MRIALNILIGSEAAKRRLLEIAESVGALAPSGHYKDRPSISAMLKSIATGELLVRRRKDGSG